MIIPKRTIVSAVECASYAPDLLEKKISEAVNLSGGWPERVKKAGKILLKPNLLSARPPEQAVTTHPEFVKAVIREIRKLGDKKITIGDSPAGSYSCEELWEKTGMKKIAGAENAELLPFENFVRIELEGFGHVPVLRELSSFDAVISLPKLKTHVLTKITAAVKNSYGLIIGNSKSAFHGEFPSPRKMAEFIAALFGKLKPDFVIADAVESMAGNGPANGVPVKTGLIFAGEDAVAVDSCACKVYGYSAGDIPLLAKAESLGFGTANSDFIERTGDGWKNICRLRAKKSQADFLHLIPESVFKIITFFLRFRPHINVKTCKKCGKCFYVCSRKAIILSKGCYSVRKSRCILCMCCMESCPVDAIELKTPW